MRTAVITTAATSLGCEIITACDAPRTYVRRLRRAHVGDRLADRRRAVRGLPRGVRGTPRVTTLFVGAAIAMLWITVTAGQLTSELPVAEAQDTAAAEPPTAGKVDDLERADARRRSEWGFLHLTPAAARSAEAEAKLAVRGY